MKHERDEGGFTLPELMVGIVVTGVIFVTLTASLMLGLRSTRDGETSLRASNAAQLAGYYLTRDVHSAETIAVDDTTTTCGGDAVVKLTSVAADRIVAYAAVGNPTHLVRRVCAPADASAVETDLAEVTDVSAACAPPCSQVTLTLSQPASQDTLGLTVHLIAAKRTTNSG